MRKTVLYKIAGFVLTNDDTSRLAARIRGKDDRFFLDMDPSKRDLIMDINRVAMDADEHEAAICVFFIRWPDDHPRAKLGEQRIAIVRTEPSLTETPEDFEQVPLEVDDDEDDRIAVEWLKSSNYEKNSASSRCLSSPVRRATTDYVQLSMPGAEDGRRVEELSSTGTLDAARLKAQTSAPYDARRTPRENAPFFEALADESGRAWTIPLREATSVELVMNQDIANKKQTQTPTPSARESCIENVKLAPNLYELISSG
ncbi:hypothetical protein M0805_003250 [Coniferiporia weirii]|nr:hypothetical protein M0805_003250 [Coniferiporia weirii]